MIFHENRLLADDSREITFFLITRKDVAKSVVCCSPVLFVSVTLKALHDFVIKGFFIQARRAGGCGSPLQKRPVGVFQLDKGETYLKTMDCFDQLNVSFLICAFICSQTSRVSSIQRIE